MAGGFQSYSTTPASNTALNGINVAEGCPPSGVNDAIRQIAADGTSLWQTVPTWQGTTTGSANAYVLTPSVALTAYTTGQSFRMLTNFANTATATLNISALGAKTITRVDGTTLASGDIPNGSIIDLVYDGTNFRLTGVSAVQAASPPRGEIWGLTLSNNGVTPNTKVDIAVGECTIDGGGSKLTLGGTATVDFSVNGAVNRLDAGTIAASTTYHIHLISNGSTVGGLASLSATAPTLPSGYTVSRRIGAVRTDGSVHILAFIQIGDMFRYTSRIADLSNVTSLPTTPVSRTLTVPTGISVEVFFDAWTASSGAQAAIHRFYCPDEVDEGGTTAVPCSLYAEGGYGGGGRYIIRTNTSAQIRTHSSAAAASGLYIKTCGWYDTRGRLG